MISPIIDATLICSCETKAWNNSGFLRPNAIIFSAFHYHYVVSDLIGCAYQALQSQLPKLKDNNSDVVTIKQCLQGKDEKGIRKATKFPLF